MINISDYRLEKAYPQVIENLILLLHCYKLDFWINGVLNWFKKFCTFYNFPLVCFFFLFLWKQNERLRLVLQEQRKQQLAVVLKRIESKTLFLLRQKDEEIAQAANRTMELEDFLKRLEAENQAWQRVAQENEATVVSLNNALEQVKERAPFGFFNNDAEDAESCCDVNMEKDEELLQEVVQEETEENRGVLEVCELERQRKLMMMMVCKGCNSRSSCMLFLPCRHLCSCEACEPLLDRCPVCTKAKKASIEALIF